MSNAMDLDFDLSVPIEALGDMPIDVDNYVLPTYDDDVKTTPPTAINPFDGTVAGAADIAFEKIHLRGLDNLDNDALKTYMSTHFETPQFARIEWIDDTSANFTYSSASAAAEALRSFTDTDLVDISQLDSLQIRPAKKIAVTRDGRTDYYDLQIRQATTSDVKKKGAHVTSRFYLMNPDQDPRERRLEPRDRRPYQRNSRPRDDDREAGDYRRNQYDDREHKRRRQDDAFDESMYDDDAGVRSADDQDRRKRVRFGGRGEGDVISGRVNGRLRDRSASPRGEGDGRYGFGSDPEIDESQVRRRIRQRSQTPPRMRDNSRKELFPARALAPAAPVKELFATKAPRDAFAPEAQPKELFPNKTKISNHRRTKAIDASPERYEDTEPQRPRSFVDRISGPSNGGSLADRITHGTASPSLANRISRPDSSDDMSIRGSGGMNIKGAGASLNIRGSAAESGGFSIKGASGGANELFPMKVGVNAGKELFGGGGAAGNQGKELFSGKLKGRGVTRRTAASYF